MAPQALVAGDHIGSGQCLSDGLSEREVTTCRSRRLDWHKFAHGTGATEPGRTGATLARGSTKAMVFQVERVTDGRWIAEVPGLSGVLADGQTRDEAVARVQALALRVLAERREHSEAPAELLNVSFRAA